MTPLSLLLVLSALFALGIIFHLLSRIAFGVSKAALLVVLCFAIIQYSSNGVAALTDDNIGTTFTSIQSELKTFSEKHFSKEAMGRWGDNVKTMKSLAGNFFRASEEGTTGT